MARFQTTVSCPIHRSFRVEQVAGMFDVPLADNAAETFEIELPDIAEDWRIGLIIGPSGSGKTTSARAAYGDCFYQSTEWPADRAVIDGFGTLPIKTITHLLTAVGLGSPPTWLRPYRVLSNGEKFRCDLARALCGMSGKTSRAATESRSAPMNDAHADSTPLVVFDEFTSMVDRTVARVASAAVSKSIRSGRIPVRLVAVTCHSDVAEWLEPDWIADLAAGSLSRRRLRRPQLRLRVVRCRQSAWRLFARHHYLSGGLSRGSTCYAALWDDRPVAFCAIVGQLGHVGRKRVSRIVTLPDYQGLGIGGRLMETVCSHERSRGFRVSITASHPAVIGALRKSPRWKFLSVAAGGQYARQRFENREIPTAIGRSVVSFEYLGNP